MTKLNQKSVEDSTGSCAHHWKIDSPSGGVSRGTCSRCGAKREFSNVWDTRAGSQPRAKR
jgi:hypothetical protein